MEESKTQPGVGGPPQSVYYQAPGAQPPPGYYGQPQQPGQQPYVMMQQQPQVVVVAAPPGKSYCAHMALACCAFWCCGGLWGLVAFIVAAIAHSTSGRDPNSASRLGTVSICLSVVGIICGIIIICVYLFKFYLVVDAIMSINSTAWDNFFEGLERERNKPNFTDIAARNLSRSGRDETMFF